MILGIDPSTKKLAIAWDHGGLVVDEFTLAEGRYTPESAWNAYAMTRGHLERMERLGHVTPDQEPWVVFLESPVVGRGGINTTMKQAFISGAVQAACRSMEWDVHLIHNSKWKREVCGIGNATKADVRQHVIAKYGDSWEGESQDAIDAIGLYEFGVLTMQRAAMGRSQ